MTNLRSQQPTLTGQKVVLRPWARDDAGAVLAACQDSEIQRWTTVPSPYLPEHAAGYVGEVAAGVWRAGGALFAVIEVETGRLAGSIGAHEFHDGVAHIGYWTSPRARGRGLTSSALRAVTQWFLTEAGAARVELMAQPENTASIRVAEAAGFVREGVLRRRIPLRDGSRADAVMYSRVASDLT